jgi:catechol 2,3-dioxygenase-like lactoylglutathione lyase family enzyme
MTPPDFRQQVTFCYVPDLAAAATFYEQVLGLPLVLDQGACRIYRVTPAAFIGFCTSTTNVQAREASGVILTLVVAGKEAVDAWAEHLRASGNGRWIERDPALNERFNIYHLFLRDPAGYLVEIQAFLDPSWPGAESENG